MLTYKNPGHIMDTLWRYMAGFEARGTFIAPHQTASIAALGKVQSANVLNMDMRYFDMTLNDGRVYRVRVSDITPEKESVDAV